MKTILMKFINHLLILLNIIKENRIVKNKYRNIKTIWTRIVEILANSKYQNLTKSRSRSLFKFKII